MAGLGLQLDSPICQHSVRVTYCRALCRFARPAVSAAFAFARAANSPGHTGASHIDRNVVAGPIQVPSPNWCHICPQYIGASSGHVTYVILG